MIQVSVDRFKNTIKDLTEISKIQKNIDADVTLVDIPELVKDIEVDLEEAIKQNEATIHVDCEANPQIRFSKRNMRSVIYNFLSNALKYRSPDRKPEITLTTKMVEDCILLSVKDNGLGIPADKLDKVFTMFKRFHDHVEGSGIGLYIVKRIIDNAEGKIEVESEEAKGSVFKVYFKA